MRSGPWAIAAGAAAILGGLALLNTALAARAERRHPPQGKFIEVNGVRLHYIDLGAGEPLVMLHGNGSMIEELEASGMISAVAGKYRVIAFDRPGFGHTPRPRDRVWTPDKQAALILSALDNMGVERAAVFAHSWGTLVALSMAAQQPRKVCCLILSSGYYFPWPRLDVLFFSSSAIPILGDLLRYTVQPWFSRLVWPLLTRRLFSPAPVSSSFRGFPRSMAFRPSQLRATGEETAMMVPAAAELQETYRTLEVPVSILAGDGDRIVSSQQADELHREVSWSRLSKIAGAGHMVHHTDPAAVVSAIESSLARYS